LRPEGRGCAKNPAKRFLVVGSGGDTPTTGDTPDTTASGTRTEAFSDDLKFAVPKI
jgi:hypothetical protein